MIHDLPLLPIVLHQCLWSFFLACLKVKEVAELGLIHGLCFWQTAELCPAYLSSGCELEFFAPPVCRISAFLHSLSAVESTREYLSENKMTWYGFLDFRMFYIHKLCKLQEPVQYSTFKFYSLNFFKWLGCLFIRKKFLWRCLGFQGSPGTRTSPPASRTCGTHYTTERGM